MKLIKFALSLFLFAVAQVSGSSLENTSFSILSTEHGLSQKTALIIYQDKNGFIWIGTQEGLNRYDGKEIKTFRHLVSNPNSISNDLIKDIREDHLGRLWIATNNGLNLFNPSSQNFDKIDLTNSSGQAVSRMNKLYLDKDNKLLIGTDGMGGFEVIEQGGKFELKAIENTEHLSSADVKAFLRDSSGRLWVGTERQGVTLVSGNKFLQFAANKNIKGSLSNNRIRDIFEDASGTIWIATRGGGINRFDEYSQTFKAYLNDPKKTNSLSHNRAYKIFQDSSKRLWIATDGGLSIYQQDIDGFVQIKNKSSQKAGLSHNRVFSIIEDRGGSLWFGTLSGVNIWNPHLANFEHYRQVVEDPMTLSSNTISAFAEKDDGTILVGTFGGGLNSLDLSKNVAAPLLDDSGVLLSQKRITSIMLDKSKRIWTGSVTKGIEIFSSDLKKIASIGAEAGKVDSLSANGITDLLQDSSGGYWASTYGGGINKISDDFSKFEHFKTSSLTGRNIASDRVHQLMEDSLGNIWAATDGGGISRIDRETGLVKTFLKDSSNPNGLSSNSAWSIFEDSKGRFWIGTQGNGLNRWEKTDRIREVENFKHYDLETGLQSNTVNGVLEDYAGFIWISTNRGVSRLNPDNDQIEHFNLSSELHFNEFNLGVVLRARSGRLFFGGLKGISTFKPENISKNSHQPEMALTKIISENGELLFDSPLNQLEEITFQYDDYFIAFEFAALDFAQPNKNQYQYKMEGLDEGWIKLGNLNRATFTSLPSGNYMLKVKGSNNDGVWSEESINLKINVLPAPWFSWWAFSLYALGFCMALLILIRLQARKIANQELFRERVSEEVEKKTALYVSNNEYLGQQLEKVKHNALMDMESGLPNQRFMMTHLSSMIAMANSQKSSSTGNSDKLMISLCNVSGKLVETIDKQLVLDSYKSLSQTGKLINQAPVVATWGDRSVMVQNLVASENQAKDIVNDLQSHLAEKHGSEAKVTCISFLLPFDGVQTSSIAGEDYLMLMEHLLTLLFKDDERTRLIVSGILQNLSPSKLRQILDSNNIEEFEGLFITV